MKKTERNINQKLISKKNRLINKILRVLNKSKISDEQHRSSDLPFFAQSQQLINFNFGFKNISSYNIPNSLNRNIRLIFEIFGEPKREIYIGEWTIMTLEECMDRYKDFCNNGQKNVFDIAYRYMGMGYIEVISCDLNTHLLFKRQDGGSNGYDRHYNYQDVIKNGSKNHEKFFFSQWFYNIL